MAIPKGTRKPAEKAANPKVNTAILEISQTTQKKQDGPAEKEARLQEETNN